MEIRKADRTHIDEIMSLYKDAKIFMDNHGNKDQWPVGYPSKELITKDIDKMYLCMLFLHILLKEHANSS